MSPARRTRTRSSQRKELTVAAQELLRQGRDAYPGVMDVLEAYGRYNEALQYLDTFLGLTQSRSASFASDSTSWEG